jgi:hypothetical protein
MEHYAGIDVSLEWASVCVVDGSGKIVAEGKVASEPGALISQPPMRGCGVCPRIAERIEPRSSLRDRRQDV